jgi:hypothetical protein
MKVIHLLCTYSSEVDIHTTCVKLWLAKPLVMKLICQINLIIIILQESLDGILQCCLQI